MEDGATQARKRQLKLGLESSKRRRHQLDIGKAFYFWRDSIGWAGPCIVRRAKRHVVDVAHSDVVETAVWNRIRTPLGAALRDELEGKHGNETIETSADGPEQLLPTIGEIAITHTAIQPVEKSKRRSQPQMLADGNCELNKNLQKKQTSVATRQLHVITNTKEPTI